MKLEELSYYKVAGYLNNNKSIILPFGSTEQHSQALPLGTDTIIAEFIANKISEKSHLMVGPTLNIGFSDLPQPFMRFAGTITYKSDTFVAVVNDYLTSLYIHGFREIIIINGHAGNNKFIKQAAAELIKKYQDIKIYLHNWWKIEDVENFANKIDKNALNHAGTLETALALAIFNNKVNKDKLTKEFKYISTEMGVIDSDQTIATDAMGKELTGIIINESLDLLNNNKEKLKI